jgi:hypothetical protein
MKQKSQIEIIDVHSNCFIIQISESLDFREYTQNFTVNLNDHAKQRCIERKIKREEIVAALIYGYSECKQGECFYALTYEMIPFDSSFNIRRSEGLVVICDENSGLVKTCYRRMNPVIYVKKKKSFRKNKYREMNMYMRSNSSENNWIFYEHSYLNYN